MVGASVKTDPPLRDEFLVFGRPDLHDEEIQEVVDCLRSGWLGTGPRVKRFEDDFRLYVGSSRAIALSSCTAGLFLALEVAGVKPGDEVITTPLTFPATANVIVHRGARPVFVDVDLETRCIDPRLLEDALTERTRAILPVHLAGRPCEMDAILQLARANGLVVIEDAAHAVGAIYRDRQIGSLGDITVFSFYVTKNVCTGEGGMLVTDNEGWADEISIKALHGISADAWQRFRSNSYQEYETIFPGYKFNMMDIQAALGIHQLRRIESNLTKRDILWQQYNDRLGGLSGVTLPNAQLPPRSRHARHLYSILLDPEITGVTRGDFVERMRSQNIGTGVHYWPLHLHKFYSSEFGYERGDFPNAEYIGDRTVSLPLSTNMTMKDIADVCNALSLSIGAHN